MSVKNLIKTTLTPINVPVKWHRHSGSEPTYITYNVFDERGLAFSDDDETITGYSVQIDVWSTVNYESVVAQVLSLMKEAGFKRNLAMDTYEVENEQMIYRKILRFRFAKAL